jgi:hypothetical protein
LLRIVPTKKYFLDGLSARENPSRSDDNDDGYPKRGWARIRSSLQCAENNSLSWLMLSWWQKTSRNWTDKQRGNSNAFMDKRILAQPQPLYPSRGLAFRAVSLFGGCGNASGET